MNYPYSVEDLLPEFHSESTEYNSHEFFMKRCLELAFKGNGWAQPNPLVGSVIVHNQQIIAEGFHRKFGENHAERMAILSLENKELFKQSEFIEHSISNVIEALRDATIFITIVLFLFLMNFRTTAITLTAIPLSFVLTFIVFKFFGMSINTMTLGGLAIAIGELVS